MRLHSSVLLATVFALGLGSAATAADIVETAIAGKFNTLVAAVKAADLVATLKGPGPFTDRPRGDVADSSRRKRRTVSPKEKNPRARRHGGMSHRNCVMTCIERSALT